MEQQSTGVGSLVATSMRGSCDSSDCLIHAKYNKPQVKHLTCEEVRMQIYRWTHSIWLEFQLKEETHLRIEQQHYHLKTQLSCSFKQAIRGSKTVKHLSLIYFPFTIMDLFKLFIYFYRRVNMKDMAKTLGTWPHYSFRLLPCLAKKEEKKNRDA